MARQMQVKQGFEEAAFQWEMPETIVVNEIRENDFTFDDVRVRPIAAIEIFEEVR